MANESPKAVDEDEDDAESLDEDDAAYKQAKRILKQKRENYEVTTRRLIAYSHVLDSLREWNTDSQETADAIYEAVKHHAYADRGLPDHPESN